MLGREVGLATAFTGGDVAGCTLPRGESRSAGTKPRDTQLRRSAQTSIGGRTTSALSSATATLSATICAEVAQERQRRGRDHGDAGDRGERRHDERAPSARRGLVHRLSRRRAAPSLLHEAQQDQRRELGAGGDDERASDRGHRAQLEAERVREQRRRADGDQHGDEREQRPDDAAQPDREEHEDEQNREVRQHDAVRVEVVEQPDADDREARRRRPDRPRGGLDGRADLAHDLRARASSAARPGAEDDVHRRARSATPSRAGCRAARPRTRCARRQRSARGAAAPGTSLSWLTVLDECPTR